MREIKFRFWEDAGDPKYSKMWYEPYEMLVANKDDDAYEAYDLITGTFENVTPLQFTGLKDKNGKEIYEGDILQPVDSEVSYAVVKFKDGLFVREWTNVDGGSSFSVALKEIPNHFEIIGNIYENPELIEKENAN